MSDGLQNLVVGYLKSLQEEGIERIPVDEEARLVLRNWMISARNATRIGEPAAPYGTSAAPPPASPSPSPLPQAAKAEPAAQEDHSIYVPGSMSVPEPDDGKENAGEEEIPDSINLAGDTLEEKLFALKSLANHWRPAKSLGTLRDTMVFATGNPHSKIMLIGEAPGYHEELQKTPFVGRAGEKLNSILKAMGVERSSIYISNIVKFRPAMPQQTTNNRAPSDKEIAVSMPIISKEIELIQPKVIIALGATAARGLLNTAQAPLSSLRGKFHRFMDIPVRVTYHPSYLLRTEELSERRKVWEDMLAVMELMQMPISDKQRGYFLPK